MRFDWDAAKDRSSQNDDLIRIIGARFATKREEEQYPQHMDQHR